MLNMEQVIFVSMIPEKATTWKLFCDIKELEVGARPKDGVANIEQALDLGTVADLEMTLNGIKIADNVDNWVGRCKLSEETLHATLHPGTDKDAASRMSLQNTLQDLGLLLVAL